MRVRAALLRLLGVATILTVVFFAAFFIAIAMREPGASRAANPPAALAATDDTDEIAVEVLDLVSANPDAVPTTDEPISTATDTVPSTTEPPAPRPALPQLDAVFDSVSAELGDTLTVPVRLPASLDTSDSTLVPTISSLDANGYVLHLDRDVDCNDSSTCRTSTFTARRSAQESPQLSGGTRVPLPNGLEGVLADSSCGEGCNNAFIIWIEDGVRYSVGSRLASGPAVLDLAWRSIEAALPTPTGPQACGPGAPKHDGQVARTISTTVDTDREMHWIAVCSELGFDLEIVDAPGELRWQDVDSNGVHDTVVRYADGTSTMFTIDNNRPRGVIDAGTGRRLAVGDLACSQSPSGRIAVDRATGERLDFVTTSTVRRVADDALSEVPFFDC